MIKGAKKFCLSSMGYEETLRSGDVIRVPFIESNSDYSIKNKLNGSNVCGELY
jgi:hypothetical protein